MPLAAAPYSRARVAGGGGRRRREGGDTTAGRGRRTSRGAADATSDGRGVRARLAVCGSRLATGGGCGRPRWARRRSQQPAAG